MARVQFFLLVVCVVSALVTDARPVAKNSFIVHGRVYCDTCRAGFETPKASYIQGAKVRVECKDRDTLKTVFSVETITKKDGAYEVSVAEDHGEQLCEAVLVSSPQKDCATIMPDRERARVILTNNNGIISNHRFANNLGCVRDTPIAGCGPMLQMYKEAELDV